MFQGGLSDAQIDEQAASLLPKLQDNLQRLRDTTLYPGGNPSYKPNITIDAKVLSVAALKQGSETIK